MSTVNPYSFVPLRQAGPGPRRSTPRGHAQLSPQCWSGSIAVELVAESRLLLGGHDEHPGPLRKLDNAGNPTGPVIIPGSTLAGSVRSIHEALTDSCLRIVDLDYVAVHRHAAHQKSTTNLRFGIVEALDGQLPSSVRLLSRTVRLRSDLFEEGSGKLRDRTHYEGSPVSSGERLSIADGAIGRAKDRELTKLEARLNTDEGRQRRRQIRGQMSAVESRPPITSADTREGELQRNPAGKWVVLVSDTAARDTSRPVWWVAGDTNSAGSPQSVGECARKALARAIEGAADLHGIEELMGSHVNSYHPSDLARNPELDEEVRVIGRRYRVHPGMFQVGMPVWVEVNAQTKAVEGLRLASLWRRPVPGRMDERLGKYQPCGSPVQTPPIKTGPESSTKGGGPPELCPSCRLFGAAHSDSDFGYRGHVRFSDAVDVTDCVPTSVTVPQLYSPKPTAGQFYLVRNTADQVRAQFPLANWGPEPDPDRVRPIRGRKFYWAGNSQHSTIEADGPTAEVQVIEPSPQVRFEATVTFDNIDIVQLRSLLAALNPTLLWPQARGRIGGGRPFGWGVVKITAKSLTCWSADRYTNLSTSGPAPELPGSLSPDGGSGIYANNVQLAALEHLLTPGFVPATNVRYPEISHWADTSGFQKKGGDELLKVLPEANLPANRQGLR